MSTRTEEGEDVLDRRAPQPRRGARGSARPAPPSGSPDRALSGGGSGRDRAGGVRRGHGLAAAGHARRQPGDADQHPRHPRVEHRIGDCHRLGERRAQRPSRALRLRRGRELRARRALRRRRAGRSDRVPERRGHDRRPLRRRPRGPARKPAEPRRRTTGIARTLQDRARTDPPEGAGQPRGPEPEGRLLPRPASGADDPPRIETARIRTGRAGGPDAAEPRRQAAVVGPVPERHRRLEPREGELRRAARDRLVAGPGDRNGIRARRRDHRRHRIRTDRPRQSGQRPADGHPRAQHHARKGRRGSTPSSRSATPCATKATFPSSTTPSRRSTSTPAS